MFYAFFCIARMNFAGPFDIGIYGALNSWFVQRRAVANAIVNLAHMAGLMALPLIAYAAIAWDGWRVGWLAVGGTVLLVGFIPSWLFMVRRPEDVGLVPDGRALAIPSGEAGTAGARSPAVAEPVFSRSEALRTPAFWLLSLYTIAVYPVQAGISLHQASHLVERGLSAAAAATIVSTFSFTAAIAGLFFGLVTRRIGVRTSLALAAVSLGLGPILMLGIATPEQGYIAAGCFGVGIGGILTVLPLAWADYFGRASFGAIRGVALTMQVTAQAAGPLVSGVLRDLTGTYVVPFACFAALSLLAVVIALLTRPPAPPPATAGSPT